MPDVAGRRRAVLVALLVTAFLGSIVPAVATASAPYGLERFLYALGQVESGGSYTALNPTSGAYGKYQIMPASWAAWAKLYLGSSTAPQTPTNQEIVAHRKVTALHAWLDTWPVVAHWWLTGSSERNSSLWSSFSRSYVQKIMTIYWNTSDAAGTAAIAKATWIDSGDARIGDTSKSISFSPSWATARYAAYSGRTVKYATRPGATATLKFTGKGIAWVGPVGPTRGTARIYLDGRNVGSVDLRRSTFSPRKILFSRALTAGPHTIRIVVTSSGRPVAIDNFIVGT